MSSLEKFVNMSKDCSPQSHIMHRAQVEDHLTQLHEDYNLAPGELGAETFSDDFKERLERRRSGQTIDNKVIEEINYEIDYQQMETAD